MYRIRVLVVYRMARLFFTGRGFRGHVRVLGYRVPGTGTGPGINNTTKFYVCPEINEHHDGVDPRLPLNSSQSSPSGMAGHLCSYCRILLGAVWMVQSRAPVCGLWPELLLCLVPILQPRSQAMAGAGGPMVRDHLRLGIELQAHPSLANGSRTLHITAAAVIRFQSKK